MAGWDGGGGTRVAVAELPVAVTRDGPATVVTVTAWLGDGRWLTLAVPVVSSEGGMVVSALPALVAGPRHADWSPSPDYSPVDADATQAAQATLTAFFRAYAAGDQTALGYYTAPGVSIRGLDGLVGFASLVTVRVDQGGASRTASATVAWRDPVSGAVLQQGYRVGIVQQNGKWLVASLAPAVGG
jgi:hypothetical protein